MQIKNSKYLSEIMFLFKKKIRVNHAREADALQVTNRSSVNNVMEQEWKVFKQDHFLCELHAVPAMVVSNATGF